MVYNWAAQKFSEVKGQVPNNCWQRQEAQQRTAAGLIEGQTVTPVVDTKRSLLNNLGLEKLFNSEQTDELTLLSPTVSDDRWHPKAASVFTTSSHADAFLANILLVSVLI